MTYSVPTAASEGMRGRRLEAGRVFTWLFIALIALLVLPPVWTLLRSSFSERLPDGTEFFTLANYGVLLSEGRFFASAFNSIVFSLSATLVSLFLGGAVAWLVERTDVPFKRLAWFTTIVSLGTPFILYVTAWSYILGRAGPLNDIYRLVTGSKETLFEVNTLSGMIVVEGFIWAPLAFLLLSATFRAANAEMEEAARMSGATVIQTILRISLPLAFPAILAFALFAFILNLEAFEVPALIGMPGRVNVLTTDVYQAVKEIPPRVGFASAFSVAMLIIISVLLYFYGRMSRYAERFATITGKGYRPRPIALGRARWAFSAIILLNFTMTLLLPLIAMIWISVMPYVQPMRLQALDNATLQNFGTVLTSRYYLSLVTTTLMVAAISATVTMLITLLAGWLAARRAPGGQMIDQLVVVPLIFPGVVLGVALLEVALRLPFPLYGTMWLIILAFIIHYMPFGMRYTYAGVLQIHPELEQAARVSGGRGWPVLWRILVPLLAPALASGWLFIFLLASKEMSLPLLLAGPSSQTISVAMFDLWGNGQIGEVAALGLLWALLMTLFGVVFFMISRRQSSMTFGV